MRAIITALLTLTVTLVSAQNLKTFSVSNNELSLEYPANWENVTEDDYFEIRMKEPGNSWNIFLDQQDATGLTLATWYAKNGKNSREKALEATKENIKLGPKDAYYIVTRTDLSLDPAKPRINKVVSYAFIVNKTVYILNYTVNKEEKAAQYENVFKQVVASLKF